jgi:hypothetical protein
MSYWKLWATATTVGRALMALANPSAIRFIRVNADNTVTALDASAFLAAIGGASGVASSVTLFNHTATEGNVTTGETDIYSDTISANQLTATGNKLLGEYGGLFVSSGTATREIKLKFAGTTVFDTGTLTLSLSSAWYLGFVLTRTGTTTARVIVNMTTEGAALAAYTAQTDLTGLDFTATNVLKLTAQAAGIGAATDDILAKIGYVEYKP